MTWSLVRKEIWQHWLAFSIAGLLTLSGGVALIAATVLRGQAGTPFEGYRLFAAVFAVLLSVVVCHRLLVLEYQARTQLFLEGLPFSRWRMLAIKYVLGLFFSGGLLALVFLLCGVAAARHDPPSLNFLGIAAMRTAAYTWCAYNFFFVMGLLGRYRAAIYIALLFAMLGLQEMSAVQFARFGPFALVDSTFAYEADLLPWEDLKETSYLAIACLGLAAILGLVREGSVAALLAERMSHREKVFVSALLVGLLWTVTLVSEKAKRVAFDLPDAIAESSGGVTVKVAPDLAQNSRQPAQDVATATAAELGRLREYLAADSLPPVFVTSRQDLDPDRFERGELEHHHGLHVQANLYSSEWQMEKFLPWVIREALILGSNGRANHESRRFVLDGFALYWCRRGKSGDRGSPITLRALYGVRDGFQPEDMSNWLSFRERVGDPIASAVACTALETLAELCDPEDFRAFIRSTLALGAPKDVRAVLGQGGEPWHRALEARAKVPASRLYEAWQEALMQARDEKGHLVEKLPRVQASLRVDESSQASRRVLYSVGVEPPPAGTNTVVTFLHYPLPPYDEEVDPNVLIREQSTLAAAHDRELTGYSRHQRLYWTGACHSKELGCDVISGWNRTELE